MQKHIVRAHIPYAALEPLAEGFFSAGDIETASILLMFDAQIVAVYDRQKDNYGVEVRLDTAEHSMTARVVEMIKV